MNEWRERANRRRDERHTKLEVRRPSGSKKDTKRWCRGVVGREHQPECRAHNSIKEWRILTCSECGRHLEYYWPSPWHFEQVPKPVWVTF